MAVIRTSHVMQIALQYSYTFNKWEKIMATVNFRVDEALKEKSFSVLKEQGIAPTEFFTNILEYIATTGKLPVQKALLSEEDAELLATVRKRINDPKEMFEEITLDDL